MKDKKELLKEVVEKLSRTALEIRDAIPYVAKKNTYDDYSIRPSWWTNGFYPGILWHLYEYTKNDRFAFLARAVEEKLDPVLDGFLEVDHDAGFIWHISRVRDYILTGDKRSRIQGLKAGSFLASRFNPSCRYIRAWNGDWAKGHSIIDSLMNLPLLYWCSEELEDNRFYNIATKQADRACEEFVRKDGSVFHIVVFDDEKRVRSGQRYGQGYSEFSSWARGTAWALYGLAISYKHTGDVKYLQTSQKVAKFIMDHMPSDYVPYADYLAPDEPARKKDSSAGAITACGFILLGRLTGDKSYTEYAEKILDGLYQTCYAPEESQAVLLHGNIAYHAEDPAERDISIIYGDYFFLEALMMLQGYHEYF